MKRFLDLRAKDIFPDLPDARKDGGLASMKQIGYVYIVAKQNDINKDDLESVEFRRFSSKEISDFIEDIKSGIFYSKYISNDKDLPETLFDKIAKIDDSELPFF